jgi:hypothetical protein
MRRTKKPVLSPPPPPQKGDEEEEEADAPPEQKKRKEQEEVVWVVSERMASARPGRKLSASEAKRVPAAVRAKKHNTDDLLVLFFDDHDCAWVPSSQTFPFAENYFHYTRGGGREGTPEMTVALADAVAFYREHVGEIATVAGDACAVCGTDDEGDGSVLLYQCDWCSCGVHEVCMRTPITVFEKAPTSPWYCDRCVD